jgi:Cellulase (glycosyl hydrolase family 5)
VGVTKPQRLLAAPFVLWLLATIITQPVAHADSARSASSAPLAGINIGYGSTPEQADTDIAEAHALNAKAVRTQAPWSLLQPSGPQSDPRAFAFLDRLSADAASQGIRIILTALSTPCWASSAPASILSKCRAGVASKANAWPPDDPASYAAFVAGLAQRYSSSLAAIEIWNEPDQSNEDYFAGPEKPQRYAAILRAAYPAVKQVDPALPVLAGSLVGSNGAFLRALYAAGIKGYYDGLSVHFYNLLLGSLRSIHEVQVANGDSTPLWLNEFGWSSCYPHQRIQQEQACVTSAIQASNLTNTVRALAHTPYIAAYVPYELYSSADESFGVLTPKGARKRSFAALSSVFDSPFQRPAHVTLALHQRGGKIIASGSGPVGDYMRLEVSSGATLRYWALFTLNRFNHYSITLPAALGTKGLQVRVYQYWQGRGAAAQHGI